MLIDLCAWWSHDQEMFSTLLDFCEWNPPSTGRFPSQSHHDIYYHQRVIVENDILCLIINNTLIEEVTEV